ncbi:MAG: hypothetical protein WHV67_01770 [Thermoanaerobaculia bacterium]
MANFLGGSAFSMMKEISEGYFSLSEVILKKYSLSELMELKNEGAKQLRELRANQPQEDPLEIQKHQRKIMRLSGALRQIEARIIKIGRKI